MKKLLLSLFAVASAFMASAQGSDDFYTLTAHTNYASDETPAGWVTTNAAVLTGGASDSNPVFTGIGADDQTKAVCINGKTTAVGTITSPVISGGIGTLTLSYGYFFSESKGVDFGISVYSNGSLVQELQVLNAEAEKGVAYQYSAELNVAGNVQLVFTNNSPSNSTSNKDRFAIWNISWTASEGSGDGPAPVIPDAPVITPASGTYAEPQTVSISASEDCTIFYTLDGTTPDEYSEIYTAPFVINKTTTVKAIALDAAGTSSLAATSVITIARSIANTLETAYTTAEAIALIDDPSSNLKDSVYVYGVVSNVDNYNANYHNLTYWLDNKSFEIYAGFGLDGVDPLADTYLAAGDTVIVKGVIKKYNSIYEMDKNNYIVSLSKFTGTPDVGIANTPETAYTIARTIELIDAGQGLDAKVYVKGTISQIEEISTSYGNASYYITDGTTDTPFEVYRGYYVKGEKFTSEDQIKVGDEVIVYGKVKKFYEKYEMDASNYIYSLNGNTEPVKSIRSEEAVPAVIYNICGQRVSDMSRRGIYIVNGKKVTVR